MLDLRILQTRRVTHIRQTEVAECGLACLAMIAGFHGLKYDLVSLRRKFPQSLHGTTLRKLMDIASAMDLSPRAVKLECSEVKSLNFPSILHWNLNHFVVIEKINKSKALIHDPSAGSSWMPLERLSDHFTGVAMELSLTPAFARGNFLRKLKFSDLWTESTGIFGRIAQIASLSIFIEVFLLASPYYTQIAIDSVLPSTDVDALSVLGISFCLFVLLSTAAFALRGFITSSLGAEIGFGLSVNIGRRLSRLPISWFEKRKIGDVLSRFLSVVPIQKMMTEGALIGIVDGCLAIITLLMMLLYSVKLSLITLAALFSYIISRTFIVPKLKRAQEISISSRAQEQSFLIETLQGVASIRLAAKDNYRHSLWQTYLAQAVNSDIRIARLVTLQNTANYAIFNLENIIIIGFGISQIFYEKGGLTIGMLMAFVAYKGHFITKATSLLEQLLAIRLMSVHLDRLSDIVRSEEDEIFNEKSSEIVAKSLNIEMRKVSFRYTEGAVDVVKDIDLVLQPGEHVALSGASGSGKSTIVKLMLGTLKPTLGSIYVNGIPLAQFGYRNLYTMTSAVTQDDRLFAGSIRDNIALFEPDAVVSDIVAAARAASVHDDIMAFPMQYETLVGDMGSALSSGQRQRVLIARALYRKPKLLIMDEGTANIDEKNESNIFYWLKYTGASMLTISHKPSTVARADRVIYVKSGMICTDPQPEDSTEPYVDEPEIG